MAASRLESSIWRRVFAGALVAHLCGSYVVAQQSEFAISGRAILVMGLTADGTLVAVDDSLPELNGAAITVFDLQKNEKIGVFPERSRIVVQGIAFSKDKKTLISIGEYGLRFRSIPAGDITKMVPLQGKGILVTERFAVFRREEKKDAVVIDLETGKEVVTLDGHGSQVEMAAISVDGKLIATLERTGYIRVWELPAGKSLFAIKHKPGQVSRMVFVKDALAVSESGTAFYNLRTGERTTTIGYFGFKAVSPDGTLLVQRGEVRAFIDKKFKQYPNRLHVMSSATKRIFKSFELDESWQISQMTFTRDGRTLIAAGSRGVVRTWDVSKLEP